MSADGRAFCGDRPIGPRSGPSSNSGKPFRGTAALRYRLRDRDRIFGQKFVDQGKAMGINFLRTRPRSGSAMAWADDAKPGYCKDEVLAPQGYPDSNRLGPRNLLHYFSCLLGLIAANRYIGLGDHSDQSTVIIDHRNASHLMLLHRIESDLQVV